MKLRSRSDVVCELVCKANKLLSDADTIERQRLIAGIKEKFPGSEGGDSSVDLLTRFVTLQEGSSLQQRQKPLSRRFREALNSLGLNASAVISNTGELRCNWNGSWVAAGNDVFNHPVAGPELFDLIKQSKEIGGEVNDREIASYAQWLRHHQFMVPETLDEVRHLISFLEWEWPQADGLGNYWEQLEGWDQSVALSPSQCQEIRGLTAKYFPRQNSLLDVLYENAKPVLSDRIDWDNAGAVIAAMVKKPFSQELARRYIRDLGWWGSKANETLEEIDLSELLITAVLLQLDRDAGGVRAPNKLGLFDIYDPVQTADRPLSMVREGFEQYMTSNRRASNHLIPLASHLVLASIAPSLLVKNIPSGVFAGSIGWAAFCQAVNFIELIFKGMTRLMTYDQVMRFYDLSSACLVLEQQKGIASIDAILDWGLINEVISHDILQGSKDHALEISLRAYEKYVEEFTTGIEAFAETPPSRKDIALKSLKLALPGADFLEDKILRPEPYSSMRASLLDLHIEGLLTQGEWDWNKSPHILERYPKLNQLPDNQAIFEDGVAQHHAKLRRALKANIKLAMSQMPQADRQVFESNKVNVFTVRESVAEKVSNSGAGTGLIGTGSGDKPIYKEKQIDRDRATGRFAVIIFAYHGNGQFICYEMLNLRGECRKNRRLGELIAGPGIQNMPPRIEFKGKLSDLLDPAPTLYVPIDLLSYTKGTEPRPDISSRVAIEKLGEIPTPGTWERKRGFYQFANDEHINAIAEFIITHRPVATLEELIFTFTVPTERERVGKVYDDVMTYIVDLIVPFKKCIEDLSSGDRNKVVDGVFGCTMDAIGIIFSALGASAKVLSIAARTVPLSVKAASFVKFGVKTAISTFNPIDGLPEAGYRLSKVVLRNTLELSEAGAKLLSNATFQVRKITGSAYSVDLLAMAETSSLGQGTWRSSESGAGVVSTLAINRNDSWFAINRRGNPWGKPLLEFQLKQEVSILSARNALPDLYTDDILKQSLLVAQSKIENSIAVLESFSMKFRTDPAIGLFMGSSQVARDNLLAILKLVKADFGGVSASNFFLDEFKVESTGFKLIGASYESWKSAVTATKKNFKFMAVNARVVNFRFNSAGCNYGEVADDLIRELLCGNQKIQDLVSATTTFESADGLNMAPLLNLAAGVLKDPETAAEAVYLNRSKALVNADSCAMLISLLNQLKVNDREYSKNIDKMMLAAKGAHLQPINAEVSVNMN